MRVMVLGGAGDMGSRAVRELAREPGVERVTIADLNEPAGRRLADQLGPKVEFRLVDATDRAALVEAMRGHTVVASALGPFYRFERPAVEAALEAGVDYLSLCDDFDAAQSVLGLDPLARERGVRVMTGCGWTPGLSNLLARRGAAAMDEVDSIRIYWAGSAGDSEGYAVILHTLHIFTGRVLTWRAGRAEEVPAGSEPETVEFPPPLGRVTTFHLGHPEPVTIPRFLPGVREVSLKGGLTEAFLNRLAIALARLGLTATPRRRARLGRVVQRALPLLERIGPPGVPLSGVRVDVVGRREGRPEHRVLEAVGHMADLTGVPLTLAAVAMGRGAVRAQGVFAPEAPGALDVEAFLAELRSRGVDFAERVL